MSRKRVVFLTTLVLFILLVVIIIAIVIGLLARNCPDIPPTAPKFAYLKQYFRTGDVILLNGAHRVRSNLIRAFTGCNMTHVVMVVRKDDQLYGLDISPFRKTPVQLRTLDEIFASHLHRINLWIPYSGIHIEAKNDFELALEEIDLLSHVVYLTSNSEKQEDAKRNLGQKIKAYHVKHSLKVTNRKREKFVKRHQLEQLESMQMQNLPEMHLTDEELEELQEMKYCYNPFKIYNASEDAVICTTFVSYIHHSKEFNPGGLSDCTNWSGKNITDYFNDERRVFFDAG
jgi:hypothetical protein